MLAAIGGETAAHIVGFRELTLGIAALEALVALMRFNEFTLAHHVSPSANQHSSARFDPSRTKAMFRKHSGLNGCAGPDRPRGRAVPTLLAKKSRRRRGP